jgi:hypothetical protein
MDRIAAFKWCSVQQLPCEARLLIAKCDASLLRAEVGYEIRKSVIVHVERHSREVILEVWTVPVSNRSRIRTESER